MPLFRIERPKNASLDILYKGNTVGCTGLCSRVVRGSGSIGYHFLVVGKRGGIDALDQDSFRIVFG